MPVPVWKPETQPIIAAFAHRTGSVEAGALASWAVWTVDSLHYLDDLDQSRSNSAAGRRYNPSTVDVAHARWATSTAKTAIDLCAAALGRSYCELEPSRELDVGSFFRRRKLQEALPTGAKDWLHGTQADTRFDLVKGARDALVHARIRRHFTLNVGGPPKRMDLEVGGKRHDVRTVIEAARDLATERVEAFVEVLRVLV